MEGKLFEHELIKKICVPPKNFLERKWGDVVEVTCLGSFGVVKIIGERLAFASLGLYICNRNVNG